MSHASNQGNSRFPQPSRFERFVAVIKRDWQIYLMLAPMIIWFIVFLYKPMYGLQIAFKDFSIFRGVEGSPWVGLEHFDTLLNSDQFYRCLLYTSDAADE